MIDVLLWYYFVNIFDYRKFGLGFYFFYQKKVYLGEGN